MSKAEIKDLCYHDGLGSEPSRISEYADVSMYRKLNFAACSDIALEIHFEWSYDAVNKCISTCFKLSPQLWRAEEFKVLMPYVRMHIINNGKQINNELTFGLYSFGQKHDVVETPKAEIQDAVAQVPILKPDKRVWFKKALSPKHPMRDERFPEYIPINSLLISDRKGGIVALPAGQPGDILCVNDAGCISWVNQEFLAPLNCKKEQQESDGYVS